MWDRIQEGTTRQAGLRMLEVEGLEPDPCAGALIDEGGTLTDVTDRASATTGPRREARV